MMKSLLPTQRGSAKHEDYTWLSKLTSVLDVALVLATSIQLGLHFWPESSFIFGIRVDYLSPTLYATDILLVIALTLNLLLKPGRVWLQKSLLPLGIIALSSLLFSSLPLQAAIWWIRVLFWVAWLSLTSAPALVLHLSRLALLWITFITLHSIAQLVLGESLQGIFYWLGERRLSVGQPGIAMQDIFGVPRLRPYSIFSHPNILAGWAVILTMISHQTKSSLAKLILLGSVILVGLTASRSAFLALLLFVTTNYFISLKNLTKILIFAPLFSLGIYLMLVRSPQPTDSRIPFIVSSVYITMQNPIFGYGVLGSLTPSPLLSTRQIQPDHFSPTLLLSWIGLVGLVQLATLIHNFRLDKRSKLNSLLPLLPLMIFDHYLLTSPPGLLILLIYLRLSLFSTNR